MGASCRGGDAVAIDFEMPLGRADYEVIAVFVGDLLRVHDANLATCGIVVNSTKASILVIVRLYYGEKRSFYQHAYIFR